ncbi:hypothetical protein EG328_004924 [Venturia inaequalis]|uniref:N-acetyltransferase domain-containing protein n=1 Tax=Venturia inaequalis TaxID=5025 RepID=A0A8H3UKZ2_VENIN|nr:hypothetical protein EG328_004924 [Venturia inaequalis]KAE9981669.1 hypothetical protein EG327_006144 [Venturia inaequalis]RDI78079.1 hypothetical protein Vi05172_g12008 [Venturia inaequalis]
MPSKSKAPVRPPPPTRVVSGSDGQVHIQTANLLLRGAQKQHATDLHKAFSDPDVMQYWSSLPHTTLVQTEEWLSKMTSSPQNGTTDFIISYNANAIGKIGIWSLNPSTHVPGGEIGFLLAKEHHRKGFMTEALRAILPYFVNQLGFEIITADVDPRNDASIDILMKFGFRILRRRDRTFQIGDEWMNSLDLELRVEPRIVETPASGVLK